MEETSQALTVDAAEAVGNINSLAESATSAANAIERLDAAFSGLAEPLKKLNGSPHGGITFQMVHNVAKAEIKPAIAITETP